MFDKAIRKYPNATPIFHSDRDFQYTLKVFKNKLDESNTFKACLVLANVFIMVQWKASLEFLSQKCFI